MSAGERAVRVEAPKKLRKEMKKRMAGKSLDEVSCKRFSFMKPQYLLFAASHYEKSTFAHDRGDVDNSTYISGLWDSKKDEEVVMEGWARVFSRYNDLSFAEAVAFWQTASLNSKYCEENRWEEHAKCQAPTWEDNVLWVSVYKYTGMRGAAYDHWRVEFPAREGGTFRMEKGARMNSKAVAAGKAEARRAEEQAAREAEARLEKVKAAASAGTYHSVPEGVTPFLNADRTHVTFITWIEGSGRTNVFPNAHPMPNAGLGGGPVSPQVNDSWNDKWDGLPAAEVLDQLGFTLQLTPLPDYQERGLAVHVVYNPDNCKYEMRLTHRGSPVALKGTWHTDAMAERDGLENILLQKVMEHIRLYADPESGIVALCSDGNDPGATHGGSYRRMWGDLKEFVTVDKEDLSGVSPCKTIVWKSP
mmetsp:Transcript_3751/g.10311  ORF Transcript_3751/g.10311 Transcript_3751/m.10311 type:complete len:418 (+) Transcript_3751:71-1324(+)